MQPPEPAVIELALSPPPAGDVGVIQQLWPTPAVPLRALKRQLERKLYLPRGPSSGEASELWGSEIGGVISILGPTRGKQEVRMVRQIEKLRAELQSGSLRQMEQFEDREIPALVAWSNNCIAADVPE